MNRILADVIQKTHALLLLVVIFGWLISSQTWLMSYIIFMMLIMLHWNLNHGQCVLTEWEDQLRGKQSTGTRLPEETFIGRIYVKILKRNPSSKTIDALAYGLIFLFTSLASIRMLLEI